MDDWDADDSEEEEAAAPVAAAPVPVAAAAAAAAPPVDAAPTLSPEEEAVNLDFAVEANRKNAAIATERILNGTGMSSAFLLELFRKTSKELPLAQLKDMLETLEAVKRKHDKKEADEEEADDDDFM